VGAFTAFSSETPNIHFTEKLWCLQTLQLKLIINKMTTFDLSSVEHVSSASAGVPLVQEQRPEAGNKVNSN